MNINNVMDSGLLNAVNGGPGASGAGQSTDELRNNFMTLLVTQLKNQDPLNPLENAELTSQLAQINTLSGVDALNETLKGITSQIDAGNTLQAAALIGKGVMVPGDRLLVGNDGTTTPFGIELDKPAAQLRASIVDGSGLVVHSFDLGPTKAGVESFVWDGLLDTGEQAPRGAYRVVFEALAEDGGRIDSAALNYAVVSGVSSGQKDGPRLDLGGIAEQVTLQEIRQIL